MGPVRESIGDKIVRGGGRLGVPLQVVGVAATNHVLTALLPLMPGYESSSLAGNLALFAGADLLDFASALARLAVLPGVAEELIFRGLLFAVLARVGGPRIAIAGSALAFGLVHIDPHHIFIASLLGLQLGALRSLHGLPVAVLAHVANNAFLLTMRFLTEAPIVAPGPLESGPVSMLLATILAGSACASLVHRMRRSESEA